jgi:hypothetical protein
MPTLLDLHDSFRSFICITNGKVHDVNVLGEIAIEAGTLYVMDRCYIDFVRRIRTMRSLHLEVEDRFLIQGQSKRCAWHWADHRGTRSRYGESVAAG